MSRHVTGIIVIIMTETCHQNHHTLTLMETCCWNHHGGTVLRQSSWCNQHTAMQLSDAAVHLSASMLIMHACNHPDKLLQSKRVKITPPRLLFHCNPHACSRPGSSSGGARDQRSRARRSSSCHGRRHVSLQHPTQNRAIHQSR